MSRTKIKLRESIAGTFFRAFPLPYGNYFVPLQARCVGKEWLIDKKTRPANLTLRTEDSGITDAKVGNFSILTNFFDKFFMKYSDFERAKDMFENKPTSVVLLLNNVFFSTNQSGCQGK